MKEKHTKLEFDVGSMIEVRYWRIRTNHACRTRNPQNNENLPVPCKHCTDIEEREEIYPTTRGPYKNIVKTWICPRVIEAINEIGSTILCLDCVLEKTRWIEAEQILEAVEEAQ